MGQTQLGRKGDEEMSDEAARQERQDEKEWEAKQAEAAYENYIIETEQDWRRYEARIRELNARVAELEAHIAAHAYLDNETSTVVKRDLSDAEIEELGAQEAERKEFCPNCEAETPCTHEAELFVCDICGEDFAKYIVSRNCTLPDVSMTQDVTTEIQKLNARIAKLEAENERLSQLLHDEMSQLEIATDLGNKRWAALKKVYEDGDNYVSK